MLSGISQALSFIGRATSLVENGRQTPSTQLIKNEPSLHVVTDREFYCPGDSIIATIQINYNTIEENDDDDDDYQDFIQIENLSVQLKGVEKIDPQWILTHRPPPGSKHKRGERVIVDSTPTSIVSKVMLKQGCTKFYMICLSLPDQLPPTFRGSVVRYLYYLNVTLEGKFLKLRSSNDFSRSSKFHRDFRSLLNIWTSSNNTIVNKEDPKSKENLRGFDSVFPLHIEVFWKEKDDNSGWLQGNKMHHENQNQNSDTNVAQGNVSGRFEISSALPSPTTTPRHSYSEPNPYGSFKMASPSTPLLPKAVCEADSETSQQDEGSDKAITGASAAETSQQDEGSDKAITGASAAETFTRGRSYNIRLDNEILVRFSPKTSDATYYFGDMIGGVLTFLPQPGLRRCLEVSITLETMETINPDVIHPSRKQSPVITKIQSEHHEIVVDLLQTHFMFSIPKDGPMSFVSTHISLQWILRFEFITTAKNVDYTKYVHPLLVEHKEKGEWVLPLTVQPPLPRANAAFSRKEKQYSPHGFWVSSLEPGERRQSQSSLLSEWETSGVSNGV